MFTRPAIRWNTTCPTRSHPIFETLARRVLPDHVAAVDAAHLQRGGEDPDIFVFFEDCESHPLWQSHMAGEAIRSFNERIGEGKVASGDIMQLTQVA